MLKRIKVKNFKSLKHVDFKCAGLNLLMGMNGAGKSSFVQVIEILRHVAKKGQNSLDSFSLADIGYTGKFADLRNCYSDLSDDVEVAVEFGWRNVLRALGDGRALCAATVLDHMYEVGGEPRFPEIQCVRRILRDDNGRVSVLHPALRDKVLSSGAMAEYVKFVNENGGKAAIESLEPYEVEILSRYHELRNAVAKLKQDVVSGIDKEESQARKELQELWRHAQKIDAFRGKPTCVHMGGQLDSDADEGELCRFDSEGKDVIEYLDKYGDAFPLWKENQMRFPGIEADKVTLKDEVNRWMSVVSPGVSISIQREQCGDQELLVEMVGFGEGVEQRLFKPQNVGFGISYTLPVVVALLTAQPEDVIIIENPEAHLHPKGQAKMGELIARAAAWGVQLFVETHSDHVVNGIRAAVKDGIVKPADVNIAFFERNEHEVPSEDGAAHQEIYSEVRNIRVDKNGSLSEYPDGFLDEWNNQLMELI